VRGTHLNIMAAGPPGPSPSLFFPTGASPKKSGLNALHLPSDPSLGSSITRCWHPLMPFFSLFLAGSNPKSQLFHVELLDAPDRSLCLAPLGRLPIFQVRFSSVPAGPGWSTFFSLRPQVFAHGLSAIWLFDIFFEPFAPGRPCTFSHHQ